MQITKNQHYVPRFYMKFFSELRNAGTKREKGMISFYQFKDDISRSSVPVESICSEDYFYDDDGSIENMLAEKEKSWSINLKRLNEGDELSDERTDSLKEFVAYQFIRTKAMFSHSQEMVKTIITEGVSNMFPRVEKEFIEDAVNKKATETITPGDAISLSEEVLPIINDLKVIIIENKSSTPLITSDAPLIVTNAYSVNHVGLGNIGAILFFPLSANKMVLLYDEKMYGQVPISIEDDSIIEVFNKYQYICADERILSERVADVEKYKSDEELVKRREEFIDLMKTQTVFDGKGTLVAAKSRAAFYWYDIPFMNLPKQLRKIPYEYRESFQRQYSYDTRIALLCRVYREMKFENEEENKDWKRRQKYSSRMLNYFDYYWNTPQEDRKISPELMIKLKTVPVDIIRPKQ